MALTYTIESLNDVDEQHRSLYVKTDKGFRVDVSGVETRDELMAGIRGEKAARNRAVAEINRLEKQALNDQITRLELAHAAPALITPERHADDLRLEQETNAKLAEHEANLKAHVDSLRSDRDTTALERVAVAIAAKLNPACVELLRPHILERLAASDVGGVFSVTVKDAPSVEHLVEQFRADPRFAPAIVGASATEINAHAARVRETLGLSTPAPTLTRAIRGVDSRRALGPCARGRQDFRCLMAGRCERLPLLLIGLSRQVPIPPKQHRLSAGANFLGIFPLVPIFSARRGRHLVYFPHNNYNDLVSITRGPSTIRCPAPVMQRNNASTREGP
jgi:hypothetical protein